MSRVERTLPEVPTVEILTMTSVYIKRTDGSREHKNCSRDCETADLSALYEVVLEAFPLDAVDRVVGTHNQLVRVFPRRHFPQKTAQ